MSNGFGWAGNRTLNGLFEFGFISCDTIHARQGKFCPLLDVWNTNCNINWLSVNGDNRTFLTYQDNGTDLFFRLDGDGTTGNYLTMNNPSNVEMNKIDVLNGLWTLSKSTTGWGIKMENDTGIISCNDNGYIYSPAGNPPTTAGAGALLTWTGTNMDWALPAPALKMIGEIVLWTTSVLPAGFLLCDGTSLLKTSYVALDALFGGSLPPYPYGSTATNFNLPDLTERVPKNISIGALGVFGGSITHTITEPELPVHVHELDTNAPTGFAVMNPDGIHSHEIIYDYTGNRETPVINKFGAGSQAGLGMYAMNLGDNPSTDTGGNHNHALSGTTQKTGGGVAMSIENPYLSLKYIIRVI
jgi:microcystin-dependent protein